MEKTGESYTAARARILAGPAGKDSGPDSTQVMPVAEPKLQERTGRSWEEWFDLLDDWGAVTRSHTEMARHLRDRHEVDSWWAQSITVGYERARGLRAVGEHADGFAVGVQRTVSVSVGRLFEVFMDESARGRWLNDDRLELRTATEAKSARFNWVGASSRVIVSFAGKDAAKSTVEVAHERLPDAADAERMKSMWREALTTLKEQLEG